MCWILSLSYECDKALPRVIRLCVHNKNGITPSGDNEFRDH